MRFRLEAADGTAVGVEDGRIVDADQPAGLSISLGPGTLGPGLINAHDHLHRNHYPRLGSPPYPDAYTWGADLHQRFTVEIARARGLDRREALLFGALKNLLGGVTTVVHHDAWEPAFDDRFPVRIARVRAVHSLAYERDLKKAAAGSSDARGHPLCIHLGEGTNREAADEVASLAKLGLLDERLVAVHAVGVDAEGIRCLRNANAAIVWCPTSNEFLFGRTAPLEALTSGIDVLLGTDALLTGAGTLLDELRAARRHGLLSDARLLAAVGATAARRLRLPPATLTLGATADVILLRRPLFEAKPRDVALVLVGGSPVLGDEEFGELFERTAVPTQRLAVGSGAKLVTSPLATAAAHALECFPECGRVLA